MVRTIVLFLVVAAAVLAGLGYREAIQDPIVRTAAIEAKGLREPLKILFISDIHVQHPDMPPERAARIVDRLDRLQADLVLLGGDYLGNTRLGSRVAPDAAIAPLGRLNSRLGTFAVLGNNDRPDARAVIGALTKAGITVLHDSAQKVGPVVVGGIWSYPGKVMRRLVKYPGPHIVLSHRPDFVEKASPAPDLFLAGHTHCGQVALPWIGPVLTGTSVGKRHSCGLSNYSGIPMVVSAGLGTSHLPIRLKAPPDVWLITLLPVGSLEAKPRRGMSRQKR